MAQSTFTNTAEQMALRTPVNVVETSTELLQPLQQCKHASHAVMRPSWSCRSRADSDGLLARTHILQTPAATPRAFQQDPCWSREAVLKQSDSRMVLVLWRLEHTLRLVKVDSSA